MTAYFLDSSAIVKRYIPEIGSGWVNSLTGLKSGHHLFIAQITQIEIVSAVSRRKREGNISVRTAKAIRLLLNRHTAKEYRVVSLSNEVIQIAMDLNDIHPLRAYDSIQLATAISLDRSLHSAKLPGLVFLSADDRLLAVAHAEGLATDNPNRH